MNLGPPELKYLISVPCMAPHSASNIITKFPWLTAVPVNSTNGTAILANVPQQTPGSWMMS